VGALKLLLLLEKTNLSCHKQAQGQVLGKGKGEGSVWLLMEPRVTATGCHLPYGITQCYLPSDASEHTRP